MIITALNVNEYKALWILHHFANASLNFHEILLSFVLSFLRDVENFRKVAKNFVELISKEKQNLFRFVARRRNFQAKEILTRQRLYQQQGRRRWKMFREQKIKFGILLRLFLLLLVYTCFFFFETWEGIFFEAQKSVSNCPAQDGRCSKFGGFGSWWTWSGSDRRTE